MLEDDEFTVLFEKDSKCSITILNYYHYAEYKDKLFMRTKMSSMKNIFILMPN